MAIIEPPPQHYYYCTTTNSTSNVSYYQTNRVYIVRWYTNYDSAITAVETEIDKEESAPNNWAELQKHFVGFKAKHPIKLNSRYAIRQPSKCFRNIRRERIQRMRKKL